MKKLLIGLLFLGAGCVPAQASQEVAAPRGETTPGYTHLHVKEAQIDGYWCLIAYFGVDAKPVSINCQ